MPTDISKFTFPLKFEEDEGSGYFPMLNTEDEEGNEIVHPIVDAIKKGGKIERVDVIGDWSDDHCPCVDVECVVDGKLYGFSAWWLSWDGFKMMIRAESLTPKAIDAFVEFIGDHEAE